ncbi:MAG TPA: hypothetical protein VF899_14680 [Pyrinomonadaceae bacterium]
MLAIERANAPKFDGILTNKVDFNKQDELPRSKLVELKNHFSSRKFDRAQVPDDLFGDFGEVLRHMKRTLRTGYPMWALFEEVVGAIAVCQVVEPPGFTLGRYAASYGFLVDQDFNPTDVSFEVAGVGV